MILFFPDVQGSYTGKPLVLVSIGHGKGTSWHSVSLRHTGAWLRCLPALQRLALCICVATCFPGVGDPLTQDEAWTELGPAQFRGPDIGPSHSTVS